MTDSGIAAVCPTKNMRSEIPAVTKLYDIILWLMPQVEKFPRDFKFTVGDRIANNLLDALETIIEAAYSKDRQPLIKRLNLQLERVKFEIRDTSPISMRAGKNNPPQPPLTLRGGL